MPPKVTYIEGIIGAGKTTYCQILREDGHTVYGEPVTALPKLLAEFYRDPSGSAFELQRRIMLGYRNHLLQLIKALQDPQAPAQRIYIERSPHSCYHVFSKQALASGHITPEQFAALTDQYAEVVELIRTKNIKEEVEYMNVSVEMAMARVAVRGNVGDTAVTAEYQEALRLRYSSWLESLERYDCLAI